ncbi:unnamed protein product [Didymodactylos carnosus]|uniref:DUF1868 domain-containing protein n=1 Tax=Didymodactylos carnosus TaxID=1234261 RepID=A0A815PGH9_9BILA|nr:unnamed protein product [Didymodactylos carnosus]CAF1448578.1 unnamed protein product [Didymodactylos carnosus]CAF4097763.1 unnamed protein product [Didymodactylos carnosus]CAF4322662.1 unnamed protein product [Didymodactylos carnosus]
MSVTTKQQPIPLYNKKLYVDGQFAPFSGYTIVSHAVHPLPKELLQLHEYLTNSELKNYYSFLPVQSFHVTINPLSNVRREHEPLILEQQRRLKVQGDKTRTECRGVAVKCENVLLIEIEFDKEFEELVQSLVAKEW